jgi:adenosylcobinamide-GDP ribazoletransferase
VSDGIRLAVGTLTRWPVRPPREVTPSAARDAMLLAPWVGLALGVAAAAIAWGAGAVGIGSLPAAALTVAALAYCTRGLHLDGLADLADGLGSGRDAAGALGIMRRGEVGAIGSATVALTLLVQVATLDQVLVGSGPPAVAAAVAASRLALPLACLRGAAVAARPGGLGATVAGTVPAAPLAIDLVLIGALTTAVLAVTGTPALSGGAVVLAVAAVTAGVVVVARRRLGGITGDVLGAAVELSAAAALLATAGV